MGAIFVFPTSQDTKRVQNPIILSAPQASIVLNVAYVGYTDVIIRLWGRSTNAAVNDSVRCKINGSTTIADYKNNIHRVLDATVNVTLNNAAVGYLEMGDIPAGGGSVGAFGLVEMMWFNIFQASFGKNHKTLSNTLATPTAGNTAIEGSSGLYVPATPIASFTFILGSGPNFDVGTCLDAYYVNKG